MKAFGAWIAVISHKRPENMKKLHDLIGNFTVYVNKGQGKDYLKADHGEYRTMVRETKFNDICSARNLAIEDAKREGLICIQVSDDLKKIERIRISRSKRVVEQIKFSDVVQEMIMLMGRYSSAYAGVAVSSNRLNYTGKPIDLDKLIVNDLIGCAPTLEFDVKAALKEDYDQCLNQLTKGRNILRLNNVICTFPHRENKGGANTYRNSQTELAPTLYLKKKWGNLIVDHKTRPGQVSLNYSAIKVLRAEFAKKFSN